MLNFTEYPVQAWQIQVSCQTISITQVTHCTISRFHYIISQVFLLFAFVWYMVLESHLLHRMSLLYHTV